jgi:hypothetical protein
MSKPLTDPMPILREIFLGNRNGAVVKFSKRTGSPTVSIKEVEGKYVVTFRLPKLIRGQTFLGVYPSAESLPAADGLTVGDYALLQSGEILQIL